MEQALAITVGMADTMMISSVGEAAVSGVSLVDIISREHGENIAAYKGLSLKS